MVHNDGWRGYDGLVNVVYNRHLRINKSKYFAHNGVHITGIEAFWSFTKRLPLEVQRSEEKLRAASQRM